MEFLIRLVALIMTAVCTVLNKFLDIILPCKKPNYPPIRDPILLKSVTELSTELRRGELKSVDLVSAYITRIREVNTALNAVVEDRFEEALNEAQLADDFIAKASSEFDRVALFTRYPLLGIPFSVKESCSVKGLSYEVGSIVRKNIKAPQDGDVVELLRAAGGIPMLVSANPEFCMSFETNTVAHGRCLNPYDLRRTTAGSSGGEAALNGSGSTPFGVGSDISGSIRLPAMFCGVFGHKPTGGLISVKGHFPNSATDKNMPKYLQIGPLTRFARDMPLLLEIMAGENKHLLKMNEPVALKDIKIHYAYGYSGLNALTHPMLDFDIKLSILRAVKCFEKAGMQPKQLDLKFLHNCMEVVLVALVDLKGIPSIVTQQAHRQPHMRLLVVEMFNSLIGHSLFTKEALFLELMKRLNALMFESHMEQYRKEAKTIKKQMSTILGNNGVLFVPTFHTSALCFNTSVLNFTGIDIVLLFNVLGFPSTHVPMGLNQRGMPIGFQVIAAPYQDKLCLQIAAELEGAFKGWVPPVPHQLAK
ncbi:fatty-acid amide hydrolase 2-B [Scaptodrosophila lebanonensis]|uniref:Fatty-acid amide hydrolase 2-B n=1 Tax=Drosophila lebanonensis TaxID=7225 RepID=A0A6J2T456_DROLE|nr:fatty-acid amide hydrolase 2-B [Scaptodrosophila lebanonensis]XP_030370051.1 fatty-acid amide hydrolase 2-B [Scaptodrosophila lebanonensis]